MNAPRQSQSRLVLPIISLTTFLGFLDSTLLIPVMALYAATLGASPAVTGLVIGLYSLTNTPANILFGRLIDRAGSKIPLIVGLLGDALSIFLYSLCRLPIHLALVRALHGVTGGLVSPAAMSFFSEIGGESKGKVFGFYGMTLAAATLLGFGLSGVIVSALGHQSLFLLGTVMLVAGAGLGCLLPRGRVTFNATPQTEGILGQARKLLKRKGLIASYCSIFAQYFTFGAVVTLLPLYVKSLELEASHTGMLLAIFALLFIITQLLSGKLSDKVGRSPPISAGLSLGIISLVILPFLTSFPLLAIALALYGLAYGLLFPSIAALIAEHSEPEERGMATGIFHSLLTAGVAIGAPTMGWVGGAIGIKLGIMLSSSIMVIALITTVKTVKP